MPAHSTTDNTSTWSSRRHRRFQEAFGTGNSQY